MDGGTAIERPHRFTVTDFYKMAEVGIFHEDSRVGPGDVVDIEALPGVSFAAADLLA